MMMERKQVSKDGQNIRTGKRGEELAVAYLQQRGYRIVARNYRCLYGEVDIIAWEGETLVFVEVKSRNTGTFGGPQEAVGLAKQKKLSRISLNYMQKMRLDACNARFDVAAISLSSQGANIDLIQNAFNLID
jgi:putative endonuclease